MSSFSNSIERTAEYEAFIKDLKNFHDRKGTVLQQEPILGGKKLDLLRIYKSVIEAGGYEKVTLNRGWKQVGDPFNFPPTCTNSAYILKGVYTKNLLGWEEEQYWKRSWNPPPEQLASYQKASSPMPPLHHMHHSNGIMDNHSNNSRIRDNIKHTGTAFTQPSARPQHSYYSQYNQSSTPNISSVYPTSIFMDQEFRARILLSLQSNLPNEIDWAFNTLIKFSYASENFSLDFIPTLVDMLLDFTSNFFDSQLESADSTINTDIFCSKRNQEQYERVLQVFHIIRNFSFLEMNIRRLAFHERLRHLLLKGICLPPSSPYGESSRHCLDILENIAPQVCLANKNDPYLINMTRLLFSNDRAYILGAIRSLTRVAVTEANEKILGNADAETISRIAQLLIVDDEELIAATLEYLYQYSSLKGNFSTQLITYYPGNLIGLLTGLLSYKSSLAPPSSTSIGTIHGIPAAQLRRTDAREDQPTIPDLTNYAHLDEPYRCLGWLKDQLLNGGSEDVIVFKSIFGDYQKLFGDEKPLGMKEFYTVLKIAFPQPPSVEESVNNGENSLETVLQNVKYSPTRHRDVSICHWDNCETNFDDNEELYKHIIDVHLNHAHRCYWLSCTKDNLQGKPQAIQHLRTHFAGKSKKKAMSRAAAFNIGIIPVDDSEVSGVPLTSALLLRNLVKYKQHHTYYLPYESELILLAIQRPKISKYILSVLGELQIN
ncbi:hypothetical protein BDB01DRAFT_789191 [Pilobolus umbonatus]|nr:hypothetical protein BDB01DRAFT_789191 [Pilobolus umbonatus]